MTHLVNKPILKLPTHGLIDLEWTPERSPPSPTPFSSDGDTTPLPSAQLQSRMYSLPGCGYPTLSALSSGEPGISEIHQADPVLVAGREKVRGSFS